MLILSHSFILRKILKQSRGFMNILHQTISMAQSAGEQIKQIFHSRERNSYEFKHDHSYVSHADIASHLLITETIAKHFPDHHVLSEEDEYLHQKRNLKNTAFTDTYKQEQMSHAEYLWVVDPLDGTSNFIHGIPYFNVSIACARIIRDASTQKSKEYECIVGVVYNPMHDELYYAKRGEGAFKLFQNRKIRLRDLASHSLQQSFISCGFHGESMDPLYDVDYTDLIRMVKSSRRMGSAALDIAKTAEGVFHLFFDPAVKIWDTMAASLLLSEVRGVNLRFPSDTLSENHLPFYKRSGIICGSSGVTQEAYDFFQDRIHRRITT